MPNAKVFELTSVSFLTIVQEVLGHPINQRKGQQKVGTAVETTEG